MRKNDVVHAQRGPSAWAVGVLGLALGATRRGSMFESVMSAALGFVLVTLVRRELRPFEPA